MEVMVKKSDLRSAGGLASGGSRQKSRYRMERVFFTLCTAATVLALSTLAALLYQIVSQGWAWLDMQFLTSFPSRYPEKAGVAASLWGSIYLVATTALFTIPLGVGAAIYLEELMPKNRWSKLIEINIANLAGVPSIVYGILGLAVFVRFMDLGRSVLAGALTLSLLILPIVIIAAREALSQVDDGLRHAAFALGATKLQTVITHVLPQAMPGILTGVILAISRAVGETAPLILVGGLSYVAFTPESLFDEYTALPLQIHNWVSRPKEAFHDLSAAAIILLMGVVISANVIAVSIRTYVQRGHAWSKK